MVEPATHLKCFNLIVDVQLYIDFNLIGATFKVVLCVAGLKHGRRTRFFILQIIPLFGNFAGKNEVMRPSCIDDWEYH